MKWFLLVVILASLVTAQSIDYDDDYTFSSTSSNDTVAWGGSYLDVGLEGESTNTHVICYDWCNNANPGMDMCEYNNNLDFSYCLANFPNLYNYCNNNGNCQLVGYSILTNEHAINTGTPTDRRTRSDHITHFRNSVYTNQASTVTGPAPYYIVYPRQYHCINTNQYTDRARYGSTQWYNFNTITCPASRVCDGGRDDTQADFGTSGTSQPNAPCSIQDGGSCSSSSQCLTTSTCTSSHCCPQGQTWNGNGCGAPCNDNDDDGYSVQGGGTCCGATGTQVCGAQPDCNDNNAAIHPNAIEDCNDQLDNDCNNLADCQDPYCNGQSSGLSSIACSAPGSPCHGDRCMPTINGALQLTDCTNNICTQCGDEFCESSSTCSNCPEFCPWAYCQGQSAIGYTETIGNCPDDCCGSSQNGNACVGLTTSANVCRQGCSGENGCYDFVNQCDGQPLNSFVCINPTTRTQCCEGPAQNCGSSNYCESGNCLTCDTSCNGNCQSSACFGIDPDCSTTGSVQQCPNTCPLPNGQNENCECDSDPECPSGYYCHQVSGWDPCELITYTNQCLPSGDYFCENRLVKECYSNGQYNEKLVRDNCNGQNKYCDESVVDTTQACSEFNDLDVWIDHANTGVIVNKQPGDLLKVNIFAEQPSTINYGFDPGIFNGSCSPTITVGINTCELSVKTNAQIGTTSMYVAGKEIVVNVVESASLVIITDSEKLYDHFPNEPEAVRSLLKQAYYEDNAVVYDLIWYDLGENNPFSSYVGYNEQINNLRIENSYSEAVSAFITQKCQSCNDIIVLGDDYVIPSYRVTIPTTAVQYYGFIPLLNQVQIHTSTDTNYIPRKPGDYTFAELPYVFSRYDHEEGHFEEKIVTFIIPASPSPELLNEIQSLQNTISTKFNATINTMYSSEVTCDSVLYFDNLQAVTPVIIGDASTNQAFNCYPFLDLLTDSVSVEINVWDADEPAILITSLNPNVTQNFNLLIQDNIYPAIHAKSMTTTDIALLAGGVVAVGGSITASAIGAPVTATTLIGVGVITAGASIGNECIIKNEGGHNWVWCGLDVALTSGGGELLGATAKKVSGNLINNFLKRIPQPVRDRGVILLIKYPGDIISNLKLLMDSFWNGPRYQKFLQILSNTQYYDDFYKYMRKFNGFKEHTITELQKLDQYLAHWIGNPFDNSDQVHNLVRVFDSPHSSVTVNGYTLPETVILKQGNAAKGWEHIVQNHIGPNTPVGKTPFKWADGGLMTEGEVMNLIRTALKDGVEDVVHNSDPANFKLVSYATNGLSRNGIRVVVERETGDIISSYLTNEVI